MSKVMMIISTCMLCIICSTVSVISFEVPSTSEDDFDVTTKLNDEESSFIDKKTLVMVKPLRNTTRDAGGSLKLRCEAEGDPSVVDFTWYKHGAPVIPEKGRVRIKSSTDESPQ